MKLNQLFEQTTVEGFLSAYSPKASHNQLLDKGWQPTSIRGEYKHRNAPEHSIEMNPHDVTGKGPFTLYHRNRKIAQTARPPSASELRQAA